ncbi:MAG: hypothetical protein P8080_12700 [Gammaproteobacteria bacterium]
MARTFLTIRFVFVAACLSALLAACAADEPAGSDPALKSGDSVPTAGAAGEKMSLERQVLAARADLARRLDVQPENIEVLEAREVAWPDTSLGCPEPGRMYAQVVTPGVLVVLQFENRRYAYGGRRGVVPLLCPPERIRPPVGEASPPRR